MTTKLHFLGLGFRIKGLGFEGVFLNFKLALSPKP